MLATTLGRCSSGLLIGDLDLAFVDGLNHIVRVLLVDGAANALASTKDLLNSRRKVLAERLVAHGPGNLNDLVERNVAAVLNVLDLLAVTRGLLERLNDQRRSTGHNAHLSLTVLDSELNSNVQTLPLAGRLGNVFTNLLGRLS